MTLLCAGCAMTPLDDATLGSVSLATMQDQLRLDAADERDRRESFLGATIIELNGPTTRFGPGEYNAFVAYRDRDLRFVRSGRRVGMEWPVLRASFLTRRSIEADGLGRMYFCDSGESSWRLGSAKLMWRGRIIGDEVSRQIEAALASSPQPLEYEFLFEYTATEETGPLPSGARSVTLAAPASDLCFSLVQYGMLHPPRYGRPLRIPKDAVAAALGALPRSIPIPGR
jgi:hypothetical protein